MSRATKELLWIVAGTLIFIGATIVAAQWFADWVTRDLPPEPIKRSVR